MRFERFPKFDELRKRDNCILDTEDSTKDRARKGIETASILTFFGFCPNCGCGNFAGVKCFAVRRSATERTDQFTILKWK